MSIKFTKKVVATLFISTSLMILNAAHAGGRLKAKSTSTNQNGGTTSVRASATKGQNGGGMVRAKGTTTNGQGQAAGGGATAVKGPNGGVGVRAGGFTADDTGNVNYQGGAAATGANGSAATTGGFSRAAGGGVMGSRSTTATDNNGNTYDGNTAYQSGTGINHTQTCYNSDGHEIKCPNNK